MEDLSTFFKVLLEIAAAVVSLGAAVAVVIKLSGYVKKRVKKVADEGQAEEISAAVAKGVTEVFQRIDGRMAQMEESITSLREGVEHNFVVIKQTLQDDVRQTLKTMHDNAISRGYISEHEYFNFSQLCQDYTMKDRLDGNSYIQQYWADIDELNNKSRKADLGQKRIG